MPELNPKKIGLVQINNSFSDQSYFPYSVGVLQAYIQKHFPNKYEFLLSLHKRIKVEEAVERLSKADIVAFSFYVWNARLSLVIAQKLKELYPEKRIVFGGPQVPRPLDLGPKKKRPSELFLCQNPFIDIIVHGEGEKPFASILENAAKDDYQGIPSISYINKEGKYILNPSDPKKDRLNLEEVPSPYLDGVFDNLMEENPNEKWIGMQETNRGCPFECTFCGWGVLGAKPITYSLEQVVEEIEWFGKNKIEYLFVADANFGLLPRDLEIAHHIARVHKYYGYPRVVSVQSTKPTNDRYSDVSYKVQEILYDAGVNRTVVVSMQSVNTETLQNIKRHNIRTEGYKNIQNRFARRGIETLTDLIIALPGETYESFIEGVSLIIENGQHHRIQMTNCVVLPDALLSEPWYMEKYGLETITSPIVNVHGTLSDFGDTVIEAQELVIATNTMPREDWVKTRAFAWYTSLLYFDKILQIPIACLKQISGVAYRDILEWFTQAKYHQNSKDSFIVLDEINQFFKTKAESIQKGEIEYCHAPDWINIYWPSDEYMMIKLVVENKMDRFYEETKRALQLFCSSLKNSPPLDFILQTVDLNRCLLKRPFQYEDIELNLGYNFWEFYHAILIGDPIELRQGSFAYRIDRHSETWSSWEDWFRRNVWWNNRGGRYLYGTHLLTNEIHLVAGHY